MTDVVRKETVATKNTSVDVPGESVQTQTVVSGASEKVGPSQTVVYLIYFFFSCLDILLAFRLFLRLTGANPAIGFVSFIYGITRIFVAPFFVIFPQATTQGLETTPVLAPPTLL